MTDQEKDDPWELLASELGTPPPPPRKSAEERAKEEGGVAGQEMGGKGRGEVVSRLPKGSSRRREPSVRPAAPSRTPAGWGQLASELGLSPPPEPEETPAPPDRPGAGSAKSPSKPLESPAEEATIRLFEAPAEFVDTPVELITPAADAEEPPAPDETGADAGEGKPERRRRKRRRRPRGTEVRRGAEASSEGVAAKTDDEVEEAPALGDAFEVDEEEAEGRAPAGAAELTSRRPKRRRRRRPGRKKENGHKEAESVPRRSAREPAATSGDAGPAAAPIGGRGPATPDDADDDSEFAEGAETHSGHERPSHRGVPTWKEAVDLLISTNLESRAKRPDRGPPSRGRGGHNRGGRGDRRGG